MPPRPKQLCVEGPNDHHTLLHLLRESGVLSKTLDETTSPLQLLQLKNKKLVIDDILTRYKEAGKIAVGYVIDADDVTGDPPGRQPTWQAVCHRLRQMSITPPSEPPVDGFVDSVGDPGPRIGIWIMPDNVADGEIETFLLSLTEQTSPLWQHVRSATTSARVDHGADFTGSNQPKAELACWLAWQKEPAMKYGEAMQAGKFDCSKDVAVRFVDWICRLFEL
jgi:hypothetical protein